MSFPHLHDDIVVTADRVNVRFSFSGPRVLKNVSFEVRRGETVCIIGPNGAGKTTLLNVLAGCLFKTRCKIRIAGLDRWRENLKIRRKTTYVPAQFGYQIGSTPYEHYTAIGLLYGMQPQVYSERCQALVSDLNYERYVQRRWENLSLGLRHKGMMIGGFLPPAELRIYDEPVASGVDPLGMEIFGVWMKEARAKGESIIFSTQVLDRAHMLADKLLILDKGALAYWGTPADLITKYGLDPTDDYALNRAFFRLFREESQE